MSSNKLSKCSGLWRMVGGGGGGGGGVFSVKIIFLTRLF